MTDSVFEIETAAIAHRACFLNDCGIQLTDFSCARPNVDRRWIFMVLWRAGASKTRCICEEAVTSVEQLARSAADSP